MTRRSYLAESIGDLHVRLSASMSQAATDDPFERSAEYFRLLEGQRGIKQQVEAAAEAYKSRMTLFDNARSHFDATVADKQLSGSLKRDEESLLVHFSLEVLASQQARDECELEYTRLLRKFDELLGETERVRQLIGDPLIAAAEPAFRCLRNVEVEIRKEDGLMESIKAKIESAKSRYQGAMLRLQEVSTDIHKAQGIHF